MSIFASVTIQEPRPLPVFLLVDTSGSMSQDNRIGICNDSVREMLRVLGGLDRATGAVQAAIITFGGAEATLHQPLADVRSITWTDMEATGRTPMGSALRMLATMLEDPDQVPERAYQPTIVLVSDGLPTDDDFSAELTTFEAARRSAKAQRLAVSIGMSEGEPGYRVLSQFVGGKTAQIYSADKAEQVAEALRWVTWSVTARSQSTTPDDDYPIIGAPDF